LEEKRTNAMEMAEKKAEERKETKKTEKIIFETFKYHFQRKRTASELLGVFDENIASFLSIINEYLITFQV
jgi:hypothetical protein